MVQKFELNFFFFLKVEGECLSSWIFAKKTERYQRQMSRRQCCVWACHNRKGRCAEDIDGKQLCGYPVLEVHDCPKPELLTLHAINKMPHSVREEVIHKINGTRQNHRGGKWRPSQNARICNVHYLDFKGPSKGNRDAIPVYFKAPNSCTSAPLPKRRKLFQRQCAINLWKC